MSQFIRVTRAVGFTLLAAAAACSAASAAEFMFFALG
jgi:hypothetical protein